MSTRAGSSRRLPARVYWVRRSLLGGLLLLTGAGVVAVATDDGAGPAADTAADPSAVPTLADVTDAPSTPSSGSGRPPGGGMTSPEVPDRLRVSRAQTVAATLPLATADCAAKSVSVRPSLPDSVVAGGHRPVSIQLALATSDPEVCTLALDADTVLVQVTDDAGDPIWDLATCYDTLPSEAVTLRPSWVTVIPLDWSGRVSGPRCNPRARAADPGSYIVESAVLGGEPASDEFWLRRPPPKADREPDSADPDTAEEEAAAGAPQT